MSETAVVVVHGVGDPLPGDALGSLVQGLVGTTPLREVAPRTVEQRVEPHDAAQGSALVNCYPVSSATLRLEGGSTADDVDVREVYWGDLARIKGSALGMLYALFDFIFGLKHIVTAARTASLAATADGGWPRRFVDLGNRAAGAALWFVRGPLFALNLLAAAVGLSIRYVVTLEVSERAAAVLGSLALAALAALIQEPLRRRRWSVTTAHWMLVVGLASAVLWCVWPIDAVHRVGLGWWLAEPRDPTWAIEAHRVGLGWWPPDPRDPYWAIEAITTAISLAALATALCGLAMATLHLFGWIAQMLHRHPTRDLGLAVVVVDFCTALGVGLFAFVAMLAWTAVNKAVGGDERLVRGLHLFFLVWLAFIGMVAAYAAVMAVNAWRALRSLEPMRYIVSSAVIGVFCTLTLVYAALVVPMVLHLEHALLAPLFNGEPAGLWSGVAGIYAGIEAWDNRWRGLALAAGAALLAALAAVRAQALTALDLVLEAVAHFKTAPRRVHSEGVGHHRVGASEPIEERWLWESIVDRFQDVVACTVRDDTRRVIIVSHSQGTTVALAGLDMLEVRGAKRRSAPPALRRLEVDVVTMGSPVDHLYRYYLPALYAIASSRRRYRWLNVYRSDDFIGRRIDTGAADWPRNEGVGRRGHTDYWRDREVLEKVRTWLRLPRR